MHLRILKYRHCSVLTDFTNMAVMLSDLLRNLTFNRSAHCTQVSDQCPLGLLFKITSSIVRFIREFKKIYIYIYCLRIQSNKNDDCIIFFKLTFMRKEMILEHIFIQSRILQRKNINNIVLLQLFKDSVKQKRQLYFF